MEEANSLNSAEASAQPESATTEEVVSMSKIDFEKKIQAAEDRVRSKLSKELRDLKAQLPIQKTEAEIEIESKLAEIEAKRLEVQSKEKDLSLREALQEANLDKSFAEFVKADVDIGAFCSAIDKIVNAKIVAQGFTPSNNHANAGLSLDQINKMDYSEVEKLYTVNPELIKNIIGK